MSAFLFRSFDYDLHRWILQKNEKQFSTSYFTTKLPVKISFQAHPLANLVSQLWFLHLFNAYNRYFTLGGSGIKSWKESIKWHSQTEWQTDRQSEGCPGPESEEKVLQESKGIKSKYIRRLQDKQKRSIFSMPKNETMSSNIPRTPVPYLHNTPV